MDIRPRVLSPGPARVTQDSVDLGDVVIRFTRWRGDMVEEYQVPPDWLILGFTIEPLIWSGHQLTPADTAVLTPYQEGIVSISKRAEAVEFAYAKPAVEATGLCLDAIRGDRLSTGRLPRFPANRDVVDWARNVVYGGCGESEAHEIREQLLEHLAGRFSPTASVSGVEWGTQKLEVTHAVMELIDKHPERFLTVSEIAEALGLSERWIRHSFKATMGMNICRYTRESKLRAAHNVLTQGAHSVTTVATQLGFNHLGRFSQYYRDRFGELPAQTLKRA